MVRFVELQSYDPNRAEQMLLALGGPIAVGMPAPEENGEGMAKVWTSSIKMALKFMSLPTRYVHTRSDRVQGVPIYRFYSYDTPEEVEALVEATPSESIPLIPHHREALRISLSESAWS